MDRAPGRGGTGPSRHLLLQSALALLLTLCASAAAEADGIDGRLCEGVIAAEEPGIGIPPRLLGAISRVESGLRNLDGAVRPWPWTINADGRSYRFASKSDAVAAVLGLRARGVASIDVGCMQINLMHHPRAFLNLDEAFDPVANVRYAMRFLLALHAETGNWSTAAAYYHSRTPALAYAYGQKIGVSLAGPAWVTPASRDQANLAAAWAATRHDAAPPGNWQTTWVAGIGRSARRGRASTLMASAR